MTIMQEVVFGTGVLALCAIIHIAMISASLPALVWVAEKVIRFHWLRIPVLLTTGTVAIVFAHTAQIWLWAAIFLYIDAIDSFEPSFYFSIATYTTAGYGDVVLDEGYRIFGAFGSIAGLLTLGISTAFLMGIIVRLVPAFGEAPRHHSFGSSRHASDAHDHVS